MAMELLDKANKNFEQKQGMEEHSSLLPEIQDMISQMYSKIEEYNYVLDGNLLPDLGEYNVHYDSLKFRALAQSLSERTAEVNQDQMGITR